MTLTEFLPLTLLLVVLLAAFWIVRASRRNRWVFNLRALGLDLAFWRPRAYWPIMVSLYIGDRYALHLRPRFKWEAARRGE